MGRNETFAWADWMARSCLPRLFHHRGAPDLGDRATCWLAEISSFATAEAAFVALRDVQDEVEERFGRPGAEASAMLNAMLTLAEITEVGDAGAGSLSGRARSDAVQTARLAVELGVRDAAVVAVATGETTSPPRAGGPDQR